MRHPFPHGLNPADGYLRFSNGDTEMKMLTAAVYTNFTTHIVDDTGIEQGDGYTGRPASEQLWMRFEKVSHQS